jgi:threonylcarbamoyladenosine tRNA methylthiotransferase MtaB
MNETQKCVYITLGCKVNQYDTQAIREQLEKINIYESKDFESAAYLLINSCTVTEKADQKTQRYIQQFSKRNPQGKIIVTGCSVDNYAQSYQKNSKVAYVFRNHEKKEIAHRLSEGQAPIENLRIQEFAHHTRAFLKIQDGCQETCAFCIIPKVRGRYQSRSEEEILSEAQSLVNHGYREIVLTGIHLGGYGVDRPVSLTRLIRQLVKIPRLARLRLSSIEVNEITEDLLEVMEEEPKFCRHLHLPLQSGDDDILQKMRRKYSRQAFIDCALACKMRIPGMSITTDIIVGFPGEEDRHFQKTLELCREVGFSKVHIFPYSDRRGTRAIQMEGKCSKRTIRERVKALAHCEEECALKERFAFLGQEIEILCQEEENGKSIGLSDNYFRVQFPELGYKNQLVQVYLEKLEGLDFVGQLLKTSPKEEASSSWGSN